MNYLAVTLVVSVLVVGCGHGDETHETKASTSLALTADAGVDAAPQLPTPGLAYVHSRQSSSFQLGSLVTQRTEFGLDKTVGTQGVFAIHPLSGATIALPTVGNQCLLGEPLIPGAAHVSFARQYFTSKGLPAQEVQFVDLQTSMGGGGPSNETQPSKPRFYRFTSSLSRIVSGIPVVDSTAWVTANANGDVCEEEVDWPAIPLEVIQAALRLQAQIADPVSGPAFRQSLSTGNKDGRVAIRHSRWSYQVAPYVAAVYEVMENLSYRHFDETAREVRFANEVRAGKSDVK